MGEWMLRPVESIKGRSRSPKAWDKTPSRTRQCVAAVATLQIERRHQRIAVLRRIRVEVDGRKAGRLRRGQRVDVPLTAGMHEVAAHRDVQHSGPVSVVVGGDELVVLEVALPPLSLRRLLTRPEPIQVSRL
jgi:hypothetical protein